MKLEILNEKDKDKDIVSFKLVNYGDAIMLMAYSEHDKYNKDIDYGASGRDGIVVMIIYPDGSIKRVGIRPFQSLGFQTEEVEIKRNEKKCGCGLEHDTEFKSEKLLVWKVI